MRHSIYKYLTCNRITPGWQVSRLLHRWRADCRLHEIRLDTFYMRNRLVGGPKMRVNSYGSHSCKIRITCLLVIIIHCKMLSSVFYGQTFVDDALFRANITMEGLSIASEIFLFAVVAARLLTIRARPQIRSPCAKTRRAEMNNSGNLAGSRHIIWTRSRISCVSSACHSAKTDTENEKNSWPLQPAWFSTGGQLLMCAMNNYPHLISGGYKSFVDSVYKGSIIIF